MLHKRSLFKVGNYHKLESIFKGPYLRPEMKFIQNSKGLELVCFTFGTNVTSMQFHELAKSLHVVSCSLIN